MPNTSTQSKAPLNTAFLKDVLAGLTAPKKYLNSKYFYDAEGDKLFQEIMKCEEYYLTRCELEILQQQSGLLTEILLEGGGPYEVVELGAGDATKSIHLLRALQAAGGLTAYYPIDISASVISLLESTMPLQLPGVRMRTMNGEYMPMLEKITAASDKPKIILFMGGNLGNMLPEDALQFCKTLRGYLKSQDKLVLGFDLKKNPATILAAYNDAGGITRAFNLNLLTRINRELNADFNVSAFTHYPTYDPGTGACKSYLVSLQDQHVSLAHMKISLSKGEAIYTEISQKYSVEETDIMAAQSGFYPDHHSFDRKHMFMDAIWTCVDV